MHCLLVSETMKESLDESWSSSSREAWEGIEFEFFPHRSDVRIPPRFLSLAYDLLVRSHEKSLRCQKSDCCMQVVQMQKQKETGFIAHLISQKSDSVSEGCGTPLSSCILEDCTIISLLQTRRRSHEKEVS